MRRDETHLMSRAQVERLLKQRLGEGGEFLLPLLKRGGVLCQSRRLDREADQLHAAQELADAQLASEDLQRHSSGVGPG